MQRICIRLLCERALRAWPVRPVLLVAPDDAENDFRDIVGPYLPILPQGDGDLGQRLARATEAALQTDPAGILIIGSDSPTIPQRLIADAQERLAESDVVIGPCDDGGFYLLGVKRFHPDLFQRVDWSTAQAATHVKDRAKRCGLTVSEIDRWYDIDRMSDLTRALEDVRRNDAYDDVELRAVLESVLVAAASRETRATL